MYLRRSMNKCWNMNWTLICENGYTIGKELRLQEHKHTIPIWCDWDWKWWRFGNGGNEKPSTSFRTEFFVWFDFFFFSHIHFYAHFSCLLFKFCCGTEFLFSILCTVNEYVVSSNLKAVHSLFVLSIRGVLSPIFRKLHILMHKIPVHWLATNFWSNRSNESRWNSIECMYMYTHINNSLFMFKSNGDNCRWRQPWHHLEMSNIYTQKWNRILQALHYIMCIIVPVIIRILTICPMLSHSGI